MEVLLRASESLKRQRNLRFSMKAIEAKRSAKKGAPIRLGFQPKTTTTQSAHVSPEQISLYEVEIRKDHARQERELQKEREMARLVAGYDKEEALAIKNHRRHAPAGLQPSRIPRPYAAPVYNRAVQRLRKGLHRRHVVTGQLFSMMDGNRDDRITFKEFQRGVAMSGLRPVPVESEMRSLFESFDVDDGHTVSYREMLNALGDDIKGPDKKSPRQIDHRSKKRSPRAPPKEPGMLRGENRSSSSNWLVQAFLMVGPGSVWTGDMSYEGRKEHNYRIEVQRTNVDGTVLRGQHIGLGQKQPVQIWLKDSGYGPFIQVTVSDNETVLKGTLDLAEQCIKGSVAAGSVDPSGNVTGQEDVSGLFEVYKKREAEPKIAPKIDAKPAPAYRVKPVPPQAKLPAVAKRSKDEYVQDVRKRGAKRAADKEKENREWEVKIERRRERDKQRIVDEQRIVQENLKKRRASLDAAGGRKGARQGSDVSSQPRRRGSVEVGSGGSGKGPSRARRDSTAAAAAAAAAVSKKAPREAVVSVEKERRVWTEMVDGAHEQVSIDAAGKPQRSPEADKVYPVEERLVVQSEKERLLARIRERELEIEAENAAEDAMIRAQGGVPPLRGWRDARIRIQDAVKLRARAAMMSDKVDQRAQASAAAQAEAEAAAEVPAVKGEKELREEGEQLLAAAGKGDVKVAEFCVGLPLHVLC